MSERSNYQSSDMRSDLVWLEPTVFLEQTPCIVRDGINTLSIPGLFQHGVNRWVSFDDDRTMTMSVGGLHRGVTEQNAVGILELLSD